MLTAVSYGFREMQLPNILNECPSLGSQLLHLYNLLNITGKDEATTGCIKKTESS